MKILVIGPSWVGDMVMAQSLYKEIKAVYPGAVIDVVAPEWSYPLIRRMPEVRNPIVLAVGHNQLGWQIRRRTAKQLAAGNYDRAIVTPRSWKSALIPFFAGIPKRTGFNGELRFGLINDRRRLDKKRLNQTVLRLLALGRERSAPLPAGVRFYPELRVEQANQRRLIAELGMRQDRPVVCFCPGAEYGPAKQWPPGYFRKLAEMLISEGYQVWTMGSAGEADLGEAIDPGSGEGYLNLCGRTRLEDTVDLMHLASLVVTNDSGLMHVAAAVGVRVEAIYGSSSPSYTPPLSRSARVHWLGLECSPCFERQCPLGHLKCLYEITPERMFESILASGESKTDWQETVGK